MPEDDPQAVKLMIYYFYHLDYPYVSLYDTLWNSEDMSEKVSSDEDFDLPSTKLTAESSEQNLGVHTSGDLPEGLDQSIVEDSFEVRPKMKKTKHNSARDSTSRTKAHKISWREREALMGDVSQPNLVIHARLYSLAEKYGILGLKAVALEKFQNELSQHWNTDDFLQAAEIVYTSTVDDDRAMRDVVVKTFYEHKALLNKQQALDCLHWVDGLAYDLVIRISERAQWY